MSSPVTVPMLSPDGVSGDVPIANVAAARQAGFKVAVTMQSPDGKTGYVPAESTHDAAAKGFKMVPSSAPDAVKASFWDALTNPVGSGGQEQGVLGAIKQVGGQAIKAAVQPLAHPIQALQGVAGLVEAGAQGPQALGQAVVTPMVDKYRADQAQGGHALAAENLVGNLIGQTEGGRLMGAGAEATAAKAVPVAQNLADRIAVDLYRNALKPPPGSMTAAESTAKVRTGLDYGLPVSASGVEKLGDLVDDFNTKIAAELQNAPNRTIDPNAVATRADQARAKFATQVNAQPDLNAIEASRQQFLTEQGAKPGTPATPPQPTGLLDSRGNPIMNAGKPAQPPTPAQPMSALDAQEMKQGTYRVLRGKYGEQGSAAVEAQKSLARGLKEEIATQFPEIGNLNAAESRLLDLGPVLERAVNRISNNHTIGIGGPIMAGGIKAATNSTGVAAGLGVLKSIVDIPAIKSQIAIALSKGAKIPYPTALARVSAYQASLGSAVADSQANSNGDNSSQPATAAP